MKKNVYWNGSLSHAVHRGTLVSLPISPRILVWNEDSCFSSSPPILVCWYHWIIGRISESCLLHMLHMTEQQWQSMALIQLLFFLSSSPVLVLELFAKRSLIIIQMQRASLLPVGTQSETLMCESQLLPQYRMVTPVVLAVSHSYWSI